jgi:tetratricopeptide (TPR) repeat protein
MDYHSVGQQAKEYLIHGQSREAINLLESQLSVHNQEADSEDYKKTMSELCEIYNDLASELLSSGDHPGALALLRKAEGIKIGPACKVKTLNTLACYYRQIGKARIAESYLVKALALQADYPNTHLNLCAVLSELGKHEDAMMQAMQAVVLMQDLLISVKKNPGLVVDDSFMPIAFLNLAVELEFLKRFEEALGFYQRAESFAEKKLHPEHPVRKNAENAVKEIKKKISEKKETKNNSANVFSVKVKVKNDDGKIKGVKSKEVNKNSAKKGIDGEKNRSGKRPVNEKKESKEKNDENGKKVIEEEKSSEKKEVIVDRIEVESVKIESSEVKPHQEDEKEEIDEKNQKITKEPTLKEKNQEIPPQNIEKNDSDSPIEKAEEI